MGESPEEETGPPIAPFDLPDDRPVLTTAALADRALRGGDALVPLSGATPGATGLVARSLVAAARKQPKPRRVVVVTADVETARAARGRRLVPPRRARRRRRRGGREPRSARCCSTCPTKRAPTPTSTPIGAARRRASPRSSTSRWACRGACSSCPSPRSRARSCPAGGGHRSRGARRRRAGHRSREAHRAPRRVGLRAEPARRGSGDVRRARRAARRVAPARRDGPRAHRALRRPRPERSRRSSPKDQRTLRELREVWLPPAREAILTPDNVERAKERVRGPPATPSTSPRRRRARSSTTSARRARFFGAEGFLPAYVELAPLARTCRTTRSSCSRIRPRSRARCATSSAARRRRRDAEDRASPTSRSRPSTSLRRASPRGSLARTSRSTALASSGGSAPTALPRGASRSRRRRALARHLRPGRSRARHQGGARQQGKTGALDPLIRRVARVAGGTACASSSPRARRPRSSASSRCSATATSR
jgi:transcription-repair coupling factor (superfamily II helicase)